MRLELSVLLKYEVGVGALLGGGGRLFEEYWKTRGHPGSDGLCRGLALHLDL